MAVTLTSQAREDLDHWRKNDQKIFSRVEKLIQAIIDSPYEGIGKPEALRFQKTGYWSRRINQEHRLVYKIHEGVLYIAQCRYHY